MRRLQELRRYIQEECDQLLLKKERLKEEVVWHAEHNISVLDGCLMSYKSLNISRCKRGGGEDRLWKVSGKPGSSPLSEETCMTITKETSL